MLNASLCDGFLDRVLALGYSSHGNDSVHITSYYRMN